MRYTCGGVSNSRWPTSGSSERTGIVTASNVPTFPVFGLSKTIRETKGASPSAISQSASPAMI
jgi:hypothetical protein